MKVNKREKKKGFYVLKILKPSFVVKIYKLEIEEFRFVLFCFCSIIVRERPNMALR